VGWSHSPPTLSDPSHSVQSVRLPSLTLRLPHIRLKNPKNPEKTASRVESPRIHTGFKAKTRISPDIRTPNGNVRDFTPLSADFGSKHDPTCQCGVAADEIAS
jgi:hypothetical protein